MKRRILFLILVCTSTFAINIAAQDRYKILFLNISPVEIGGKKCQVSDTFNTDEVIVFRDVANGKKATTLGMWLYIPENAFSSSSADGKANTGNL